MVPSSGESIKNAFLHFRRLELGEIDIGKSSVGAGYQDFGPSVRKVNWMEGKIGADSDSSIQDRYPLRIMTRGTAQLLPERPGQSPEFPQRLQSLLHVWRLDRQVNRMHHLLQASYRPAMTWMWWAMMHAATHRCVPRAYPAIDTTRDILSIMPHK
jgi:hypothetical protein